MDRISALIDGELQPEEEQALRVHMSACDHCRRYYEVLRDMSETMGELEEPPEQLKLGVMQKLPPAAVQPKVRRMTRYGWKHYTALAACLAVVLLGGTSLGNLMDGAKNEAAFSSLPYATSADTAESSCEEETEGTRGMTEAEEAKPEAEMYNGMSDTDYAAGTQTFPEEPAAEGSESVYCAYLSACLLKEDVVTGKMSEPEVLALLEKTLSDPDAAQADVPEREADYVLRLESGDDAYEEALLLWTENGMLLCRLQDSDGPCMVLPIPPEEFLSLFS